MRAELFQKPRKVGKLAVKVRPQIMQLHCRANAERERFFLALKSVSKFSGVLHYAPHRKVKCEQAENPALQE